MKLNVKEFAKAAFLLPATVFSGLTDLVLGTNDREVEVEVKTNKKSRLSTLNDDVYDGQFVQTKIQTKRQPPKPGLLSLLVDAGKYILDAIKSAAGSVANFIYAHRKAIATAFWASLALAGAAALTVFLWPAALAAVTTFSIYGLSIAGVVGANTLAQIGAVAALTFAATSAATYLTATIVNAATAVKQYFANRHHDKKPTTFSSVTEEESTTTYNNPLSGLHEKTTTTRTIERDRKPAHTTGPLFTPLNKTASKENITVTLVEENLQGSSKSLNS